MRVPDWVAQAIVIVPIVAGFAYLYITRKKD